MSNATPVYAMAAHGGRVVALGKFREAVTVDIAPRTESAAIARCELTLSMG